MGRGSCRKSFDPRLEQIRVHAAAPGGQVREAARLELLAHGLRADHATRRRAVKAVQQPVREPDGDRKPGPQVLGELGVVRGREANLMPQAVASRRQSERTLGGDVQCLRVEIADAARDLGSRPQRQPDLRIGGAGDAAEVPGSHHAHFVPEAAEPLGGLRQSAHHAVGLRKPGVGHDHDSHACRRSHVCMTNV